MAPGAMLLMGAAMRGPPGGQRVLADYIREQARRWDNGADHQPEDPRHRRRADGLRELAGYVLGLPADDQREDCGAFLARLLRLMRDGALRHARAHGVLGDA